MSKDPHDSAQREVERLWRSFAFQHPASLFAERVWAPPVDMVVSDDSARVLVEIAGVPRDQVRVRLRGRTLEIRGRRLPPRQEVAGAHYHRAEIYFGDFERTIELPWEADELAIEARVRDGMLEIRLRAASRPSMRDVPIRRSKDLGSR